MQLGMSPEPRDPTPEAVEAASRAQKVVAPPGWRCTSWCLTSLSLWKEPLTVEGASHCGRCLTCLSLSSLNAPCAQERATGRRPSQPPGMHARDSAAWRARSLDPPSLACSPPNPEDAPVATGDWRHAMQRRSPRVTAAGRARGAFTAEPARAGGRRARGARLRRTLGRPPTSPHRRRGAHCRGPCTSGRPTRRGARSRGRSA
jgi:hypothetical protein